MLDLLVQGEVVRHLEAGVEGEAAAVYALCGKPVIAITGTNGKTTISQLCAQLLDRLGHRCGIIGTLGWGFFGAGSRGFLARGFLGSAVLFEGGLFGLSHSCR